MLILAYAVPTILPVWPPACRALAVVSGRVHRIRYLEALARRKAGDWILPIQAAFDSVGRVDGTWRKVRDQRSPVTGTMRC